MPPAAVITSACASLHLVRAAPGWDCINARQRKYARESRVAVSPSCLTSPPTLRVPRSAGLFARGLPVHCRDGLAPGGKRIRTFGPTALQADPISAVRDHD